MSISPPAPDAAEPALREACRALAEALVTSPAVSLEADAALARDLGALACAADLTSRDLAGLPSILSRVYPRFSSLALQCARRLVEFSAAEGGAGENGKIDQVEAWLCLARISIQRRDGVLAREAVSQARRLSFKRDRATAAWCDLLEGQALEALGHLTDVAPLLMSARSVFQHLDESEGRIEVCLELSHHYMDLAQFDRAQAFAQEAARQLHGDAWRSCRVRIQLADLALNHTRYAEAARLYAELAPHCRANGWRLEYAHVRLMQGILRTQQGAFTEAQEHLNAAERIYRDEGTGYYVAVYQRALSNLYRGIGRYEEAMAAAQDAIASFRALGHELAVGRCYHALGMVYHSWNRNDEALAAYDKALPAYQAAGHRYGEIAVKLNQAQIHEARGHYHAALAAYEACFAGARECRLPNVQGHCCNPMAMLNGRLGRYEEALALYRAARRYHRRTHDLFDAYISATGQASILCLMGRITPARRLLAEARRYFRADQRPAPLAFCELTLGEIAASEGRLPAALRHYQAALDYFDASGQTVDAAVCRLSMGEAYLAAGDPARAADVLEKALERLAPGFPDLAARAEHALGRAALAANEIRVAAEHYQNAVDHTTSARRGIITEIHAGSFFERCRRIYEDALDGWLAAKEPSSALEVVEASKGQVLASLLQQREVIGAVFTSQSPQVRDLWERTWRVGRELDALRFQWPEPGAGGTRCLVAPDDVLRHAPGDTADRLAALADQQQRLFESVRRSSLSFDLLDPVTPFSLERFRGRATDACGAEWGALAYYLRRDRLDVFWFTASEVRAWRRSLSRLDVEKLRQAVATDPEKRELIYAGRLRGVVQPTAPGPRILRDLAALLIPEEMRRKLAPERPLLVSPHGLLHYLPFQALLLDDGRPLLECATISYAPTLRIWEGLAERRAVAAQPWGKALFCGLSEFDGQAPPLAFAEIEAHDLAQRFGTRARLLLGREASHERVRKWSSDNTLAEFDVVHLATHATFDGAHPLQSRVLLSDGALAVPDLFRLRLNARLVTLSACQTALSVLEPGDELLGLREALLFAGANTLLVSLWAVDDASTGRLMAAFYEELLRGRSPAAALASAQRQMRAAGESPFHWAPFVVIG